MTSYTPREGDRALIHCEVEVRPNVAGMLAAGRADRDGYLFGDSTFNILVEAGAVSLIRRAEPDWKPGDIGQHVETGERYLYRPYDGSATDYDTGPWLAISSIRGRDVAFRTAEELRGKLVRCTVTPEGDAPPDADHWHEHVCRYRLGGQHPWRHNVAECQGLSIKNCPDSESHP